MALILFYESIFLTCICLSEPLYLLKYKTVVIFAANAECGDDRLQLFNGSCFLFVSYPEVTWQTAKQICKGLKVSVSSCTKVQPAFPRTNYKMSEVQPSVRSFPDSSPNE